jgi:hypothetical protein
MHNTRVQETFNIKLHHLSKGNLEVDGEVEDAAEEAAVLDRVLESPKGTLVVKEDKGNSNRWAIFLLLVINAEASGTRPSFVQVVAHSEDEDEDAKVVIAGDVLEAEAKDVKCATRAWPEPAMMKVLEP